MGSCERETTTVIMPEVEGDFEPQEPVYLPGDTDTVYLTKWRTATDTIEITTETPVNDSLVLAYQKLEDSLERFKLYLDAVSIRRFSNTFEDEYLKANVSGEVQGHLNYVDLDYTIKEREIEIPNKRWALSIYAGYGVGKEGLSPQLGVGLGYRLFSF